MATRASLTAVTIMHSVQGFRPLVFQQLHAVTSPACVCRSGQGQKSPFLRAETASRGFFLERYVLNPEPAKALLTLSKKSCSSSTTKMASFMRHPSFSSSVSLRSSAAGSLVWEVFVTSFPAIWLLTSISPSDDSMRFRLTYRPSRSLPLFLCGEKRLEDSLPNLFIHPVPVVAYLDPSPSVSLLQTP